MLDPDPLEVKIGRPELLRHNRWNAGYFEERFRQNEQRLKKLHSLTLARECDLRLVITLPRVFNDNNARMAIVCLMRNPRPSPNRKIILAAVREKWQEPGEQEQPTDLFGELETIVNNHVDL